jgi:hypothetical protein
VAASSYAKQVAASRCFSSPAMTPALLWTIGIHMPPFMALTAPALNCGHYTLTPSRLKVRQHDPRSNP